MAITIHELFESRTGATGDNASQERRYIVRGTNDDVTARITANQGTPIVLDLFMNGFSLVWRQSIDLNPIGDEMWEAVVQYSTLRPEGIPIYSDNTSGGTAHIKQAIDTIAAEHRPFSQRFGFDKDHPIGITKDGIEGVDIFVPVKQFSWTLFYPQTFVTNEFVRLIFSLTAKVNSTTFKGFAAGEVLFLGATRTLRGGGDWEVTYQFAASPNITGIIAGKDNEGNPWPEGGMDKRGWDYYWVEFEEQEDESQSRFMKRAISAFVQQVYYYADLNQLAI